MIRAAGPPPGRMSLCVDAPEFWEALEHDIRAAQHHVFVQTLSFEGDAAGLGLAEALLQSPARDKRIVVDSVTKYVLNDRLLVTPWAQLDRALRQEARETRRMVDRLRSGGVGVRFVWPIGGRLHHLPVRNHKKVVLIDDRVVYLGGINFSAHNFAWHDLMLRLEGGGIATFLKQDFLATWGGNDRASAARFGDTDIFVADGRGSAAMLAAVSELIAAARERVYLQCPYVTSPFFELLHDARRRGVKVTVVNSEIHNRWGLMRWGVHEACRRAGLQVRFYQGRMTHVKAMLVDDDALVLGSANFDFVSYELQPEIICVVRDPAVIADFRERVIRRDIAISGDGRPGRATVRGRVAYAALRLAERVVRRLHPR